MTLDVRVEGPADRERVEAVHRAAFGGEHGEVVARLVAVLRARPGTTSLVAERGGTVVGSVVTSLAWLDAPAALVHVRVLSPLGVAPRAQRSGVGTALVHAAVAGADDVPAVFLEGDPAYYGRRGFRAAGPLGFRRPSLRIPEAAFQVALRPGAGPGQTGTLVYPDVFWDLDAVGLRERP